MKYLMIVCFDPTVDQADATGGMDIDAWVAEMDGRGVRLEGRALDQSDATTVRVRGGETLISDGPFAETKEFLAGYYLLNCPDLDTALDHATRLPAVGFGGSVEVRPVWDRTGPMAAGREQVAQA